MSYQSEAQLEEQLIQQLNKQGYDRVTINTEEELIANFKEQFSIFNKDKLNSQPLVEKEWDRVFNQLSIYLAILQMRTSVFMMIRSKLMKKCIFF